MKLGPFYASDYLNTPEEVAAYLEAALAEGDDAYFLTALGTAARGAGMAKATERMGLALGDRPAKESVVAVLDALGVRRGSGQG